MTRDSSCLRHTFNKVNRPTWWLKLKKKQSIWLFTNALQSGEPVLCGGELVAKTWTRSPDQVQQHKQILQEKEQREGEWPWGTIPKISPPREAHSHSNRGVVEQHTDIRLCYLCNAHKNPFVCLQACTHIRFFKISSALSLSVPAGMSTFGDK